MMKKFVLTLLVALMVMPSMVCAMPFCTNKQSVAPPCHKMAGQLKKGVQKTDKAKLSGVMLQKDCMGTDLFAPDNSIQIAMPDLAFEQLDHEWVDMLVSHMVDAKRVRSSRGPPDWILASRSQDSVYLSTKRLRL